MKYIAFLFMAISTTGFAVTLRVSVPLKNPLNPYKNIENLTYCNLASPQVKVTATDPLPSRNWQINIKDLNFADGSAITKEDLLSSLSQSSQLTRSIISKVELKAHLVEITTKLPMSDPSDFLSWPIAGTKPSRFCGKWKSITGDLNHLKLETAKNQILVNFSDQKIALEDLRKGLIDVLIPETWSEIDIYLRRNPHINLLRTSKPKRFYFHLNPNRSLPRQTRIEILSNLNQLKMDFPFLKKEKDKNKSTTLGVSTVNPRKNLEIGAEAGTTKSSIAVKKSSLVTSAIANPESIRLLKRILTTHKTSEDMSSIRASDQSTLEDEIRTNKLDAWLLEEEKPWINYHSKLATEIYGKAAPNNPILDKLIEDSLKDENEENLGRLLNYLENEGLMKEVAEINSIALVGKAIKNLNIKEPGDGGRFLEKIFGYSNTLEQ